MDGVDNEQNNQQQGKRKPLQLISIKNRSLELNSETWKILQSQIPDNNQVAIVGVAGSPKSGKSLLANYVIEYLENHQNPGNAWLKTWEHESDPKYSDETEKGDTFEHFPVGVRGPLPPNRNKELASGVYCWVIQPPVKKGVDKYLSILVLDIHINFEGDPKRPNIYGALVDFVFLTSSLVIYLDKLENWTFKYNENEELWSPSSSSVQRFSTEYFQNCWYILRGWNNPKLFKFGSIGGSEFLSSHLLNKASPFHGKAADVKSCLRPHFTNFTFHLLPESKAEFSRILRQGSKEYIKYLTFLVNQELDVEEIVPAKFPKNSTTVVAIATLENFLKYPLNVISISPYETNIDLPFDEKMDADVNPPASAPTETRKIQEDLSPSKNVESHSPPQHIPTPAVASAQSELENTARKIYPDLSQLGTEENGENPMEEDSNPLEDKTKQEVEKCPAMDQTKTSQEMVALDMLENELKPYLKILQSSKYFFYPNVHDEFDKIKTNLKNALPTFFTPENTNIKIETEYKRIKTVLQKFNNTNKKQRTEKEGELEKLFDSLKNLEFQRWKLAATKNIPEPFTWPGDLDKLHGHFNSFLKSLTTPTSPDCDLEFKKKCQETCKEKIDELLTITNFSSSIVHEYSRQMQIELEKTVCTGTNSEFIQLHETVLSSASGKCSTNFIADFQKNVWNSIDNLTRSIVPEYQKKFQEKNDKIRQAEAGIVEKAIDFSLNKYTKFMNQQTSQGSGIFKKSEIFEFHNIAHDKIKKSFTSIPNFIYTMSWEMGWKKLDKKLKELKEDYQQENAQRMEKNKRQRSVSIAAAENEYRRVMNASMSTQDRGKSLSQEILEKFHEDAVNMAFKLYENKMEGVKEDSKKFWDTLVQKFMEAREILIRENDEKVTRELKEEEEAKAKEEERQRLEMQRQKERKQQLEQEEKHKREAEEKFKSLLQTKMEDSQSSINTPIFPGGVAIHFNQSGVHVAFLQVSGFTTIFQNFPPSIAFTPQGIVIGADALSLKPVDNSSEFARFDLFLLVQSDKNEAQRFTIQSKVIFLRTEEIFAIFLHKLSLLLFNSHPDFHPSSCHVEFVISPFFGLPAKHMIKNALDLAGFSKTHILQSTSAMALTYFYHHPDKLQQCTAPQYIVAIHSSPTTFDLVLSNGSCHKVTNLRQTGLPYFDKQANKSWWRYFVGGQSGDEKVLTGLLKSILKECRLKASDIKNVIYVVGPQNSHKKLRNAVEELFDQNAKVVDEIQGILRGAATFAAWKSGFETFSPKLKLQEIHPYYLRAQFFKKGGKSLFFPLRVKHDPYGQQTDVQPYTVPQEVSQFSKKICVLEANEATSWKVAEFEVGNENKQGTIVGSQLHFHISPEGLINVQCPLNSPWNHLLPIKSKSLWLSLEEMESARKKLVSIFPTVIASTGTNSSVLQSPEPSSSYSKGSVSVEATVLKSRGGDSTDGRPSSQNNHRQPSIQADVSGGELDKEKKELESLTRDVKARLEKSPSTSSLIRGAIEALLKEIEGVLKSSGVDPALLKSYAQKLENRAKKIK